MSDLGIIDTVMLFMPMDALESAGHLAHSSIVEKVNNETGEIYQQEEKQYSNLPGIYLTKNQWGIIARIDPPICVGRQNNLIPADSDVIIKCNEELKLMLNDSGIRIRADSKFSVIRLDLAKNILCDYPISGYKIVFDSLHFSRMIRVMEGTSFMLKNGQREIQFYDKSSQLRRKKFEPEHNNIMRCEIRFLNARELQRIDIHCFGDLVRKYHELVLVYNDWIENILPEVPEVPNHDLVERMLELIHRYGWKEAAKILQFAALIDVPENQLKDAMMEKLSASRAYDLMRERRGYLPMCHELLSSQGSQYYKLYNEVRMKLLYQPYPAL